MLNNDKVQLLAEKGVKTLSFRSLSIAPVHSRDQQETEDV